MRLAILTVAAGGRQRGRHQVDDHGEPRHQDAPDVDHRVVAVGVGRPDEQPRPPSEQGDEPGDGTRLHSGADALAHEPHHPGHEGGDDADA